MITDRHGQVLNRGDEVALRARVLSTFENNGAQSIVVAILSPAYGEGTRFGVRSDEIEKVNPPAVPDGCPCVPPVLTYEPNAYPVQPGTCPYPPTPINPTV